MPYDISIMRTGQDGRVDYRFSGLNSRISGKEKLTQHFIKHLYNDNIGGLIKTVRTVHNYGEREILNAVYRTVNYIKNLQAGKSLHPDETLVNASVRRLVIRRKEGIMEVDIVISTLSGATTISI